MAQRKADADSFTPKRNPAIALAKACWLWRHINAKATPRARPTPEDLLTDGPGIQSWIVDEKGSRSSLAFSTASHGCGGLVERVSIDCWNLKKTNHGRFAMNSAR
jgi:hypothetical protein